MIWVFIYPNKIILDVCQHLHEVTILALPKTAFHSLKSRGVEGIVYSRYVHQVLKVVGTNVFTLQPSQLFTANSDIRDH